MRHLRTLAIGAATVLLSVLGATGCTKKVAPDQVGALLVTYPEGQRDTLERTPSDLVVWLDQPNEVINMFDGDTTTYLAYRTGQGAAEGVIFDYVGAGGYQVFRRESGGGYRWFNDFPLIVSQRWSDRMYYGASGGTLVLPPAQIFAFADPAPPAILSLGYVGRAVITGLSSKGYPLTNLGQVANGGLVANLPYTGDITPPDSLINLSWQAVPGAVGYWVHIYQTRADIRVAEESITIGLVSPIALGKVRDLFIGYLPAAVTSYKIGDALPDGARVLVYRVLTGLQAVLVRVSAVDANGAMIASTGLSGDMGAFLEEVNQQDRLRVFPLGSVIVTPGRPPPPELATGVARLGGEAIDSGVPGLTYIRNRTAPHLRVSTR